MVRLDDALLNRLGAYVDGELSAIDAAEIEELIDRDAEIRQAVEGLKASTRVIRDDFLGQIEEEPIPEEWIKLIEAEEHQPGPANHALARLPMIAGLVFSGVVLGLCALTYINLIEIRELRQQLALMSNQPGMLLRKSYQQTAGSIAQSTAIAGSGDTAGDASTDARPDDLNHRLALAAAGLKANGSQEWSLPGENMVALQQIEALRATLTKVSDPIRLIITEHRLLDRQDDVTLPMIGQVSLEPILSKLWGRRLIVPNLEREGFTFQGGRLVAIEDQPAAHLIYRHTDGQALSLWITPGGTGWYDQARDQKIELNLVTWSEGPISYLLVGARQRLYLERIRGALVRG